MGRKKKIIPALSIERIGAEGQGIAHHNGKVIFVEGGIPGDVADIFISREKKKYSLGKYSRIISESDKRIEPFCDHFGDCGGCRWQHLGYADQIEYKQQIVTEAFEHIGKMKIPEMLPILPSPKEVQYRNKMEYTFSDKRWLTSEEIQGSESIDTIQGLGFHKKGAFDKVLNIENCHLQDSTGNKIRNFINGFAIQNKWTYYNLRQKRGFLRNLILRNNKKGEWMIILSVNEPLYDDIFILFNELKKNFSEIVSYYYVLNTKGNDTLFDREIIHWEGQPHLLETLGDQSFIIGPKSFFQTNSYQVEQLYGLIIDFAGLTGNEKVYDLYTGTGSIALQLAASCDEITGIEIVEEAIIDARENAKINKVDNAYFFSGDMKKILTQSFYDNQGHPDVIITDPPRAGMHPDVIDIILLSGAKRIVYVSCNPSSQARDIQMLATKYELKKCRPVDMFPHTFHVENVALLELK